MLERYSSPACYRSEPGSVLTGFSMSSSEMKLGTHTPVLRTPDGSSPPRTGRLFGVEDGQPHNGISLDAIQHAVRKSVQRPTPNLRADDLHGLGMMRDTPCGNFDGGLERIASSGVISRYHALSRRISAMADARKRIDLNGPLS